MSKDPLLRLGSLCFLFIGACELAPPRDSRVIELAPPVHARTEGGLQDTILLDPRLIATRGGHVVVYDHGRHAVESFDRDGRLSWTFGTGGDGPGEFRMPIGLAVDEQGDVRILDRRSLRLTRLDARGRLLSEGSLPDTLDDIVGMSGLPDGRLLLRREAEPALVVLSSEGDPQRTLEHPWTGWPRHHRLSAGYGVAAGADGKLATLLYFGGGFVSGRLGDRSDRLHPYIEPLPLPGVRIYRAGAALVEEVDATAIGVRGAALVEDELLVLFEGRTELRRRLIDRYSASDGAYRGSWLLPGPARLMAAADGVLATVEGDVLPTLVIRTSRDGPLGR